MFAINPKLIRKFKEAYTDLDKTDGLDTQIIADRLRFGRLNVTAVMHEPFIALQRLTRMRYHLVHQLTREKQYFLQHLFDKCSSFSQEVDSSVFGHTILELLIESLSVDEISQMDVQLLAGFLCQNTAGLSSLLIILSLLNQKVKVISPKDVYGKKRKNGRGKEHVP